MLRKKIEFPLTHNLRVLLEQCKTAGIQPPKDIKDLPTLTPYVVAVRYPALLDEISLKEMDHALALAARAVKWAGQEK